MASSYTYIKRLILILLRDLGGQVLSSSSLLPTLQSTSVAWREGFTHTWWTRFFSALPVFVFITQVCSLVNWLCYLGGACVLGSPYIVAIGVSVLIRLLPQGHGNDSRLKDTFCKRGCVCPWDLVLGPVFWFHMQLEALRNTLREQRPVDIICSAHGYLPEMSLYSCLVPQVVWLQSREHLQNTCCWWPEGRMLCPYRTVHIRIL